MRMKYRTWCPEHGQTADEARCYDAEEPSEAAKIWADCDDFRSTEFLIAKGEAPVVCVQLFGGGPTLRFRVRCQQIREYFADAV